MKKTVLLTATFVLLTAGPTQSLWAAADVPVTVKVELHPMGSFDMTADSIIGKGEKKGSKYTAKEVKVLINKLKTGMALRDEHMKKKLDMAKNKFILVQNIVASNGEGTAEITIKGIKKPVKFKFKDLGSKKAEAKFQLHLKDFGITGINYGGVGVQDLVEISATVPYDEL